MTTDDTEDKNSQQHSQNTDPQEDIKTSLNNSIVPEKIKNIFECLSRNNKIIFRSQQRNEPEISQLEKMYLAMTIYQRNPATFLNRFGKYMEEGQLEDFAGLAVADSDEEMHLMIVDYQKQLKSRKQDVKNRRYAAMQKLIAEGEYFSEQEMMKRSPVLYQELVGQYLSDVERKQRDSYDVRNTSFSGILMHNLEQQELSSIMEKAEKSGNIEINKSTNINVYEQVVPQEDEEDDEDGTKYSNEKECTEDVPLNCQNQWGNFDNEQIACSSSKVNKEKIRKQPKLSASTLLITSDERNLLKQEFVSQMHEQFLSGLDQDFEYSAVDDNTQYDDLKLLNQDKEDKYFDESDDDDEPPNNAVTMDEGSEDELDIYMSHLNKHHSLRS